MTLLGRLFRGVFKCWDGCCMCRTKIYLLLTLGVLSCFLTFKNQKNSKPSFHSHFGLDLLI